jgi:hypothetical protein
VRKPPLDLEWRVQGLLRKFGDTQRLSFQQRFRYNTIAQRYAVFSELWRQKLRIKEEGYRRPEDSLLSIQGLRTEQEREAARALGETAHAETAAPEFVIDFADSASEGDKARLLFDAVLSAKRRAGEADTRGHFEGFLAFIKFKTEQIREQFQCQAVEYRVEVQHHKVRLTARAKV